MHKNLYFEFWNLGKKINLKFLIGLISIIIVSGSFVFSQLSGLGGSTTGSTAINNILCQVYTTVMDVIFVLAIVLMVSGGALYAASRILPANLKGQLEGYAYGMLLGGVVGIILVIMGPDIIKMIVHSSGVGASDINSTGCSGISGFGTL